MRKHQTVTKVYNSSSEELGMDRVYMEVPLTINLDRVESYRKELDDSSFISGKTVGNGTFVYMESGEFFWIKTEYEKLNSLISDKYA